MFQKFAKLCVACALSLGLVACSSSEEEMKQVDGVVEEYLVDCKNGDYEKADGLLSKNASANMDLTSVYEQLDQQLESLGLGEDFNREARSFVSYFMENTFKEYKIDDTKIESKNEATVDITLKGKDADAFDLNSLNTELENEVTVYLTEHEAELQAYLEDHTEEELTAKLYKDLSELVFGNMKGLIDELPDIETKLRFSLEKEEDTWKITDLGEIE